MNNQEYGSSFNLEKTQAYKLAQEAVDRESKLGGSAFSSWKSASLKDPILVRTVHKEPSYWLFPVEINEEVAGFVRVLGNGRVAHVGSVSPSKGSSAFSVVTGLTQDEAAQKVRENIHLGEEETLSLPFYVHDGPIGREIWLIEVLKGGKPYRWIFITSGFIYERPAGVELQN